MSENDNNNIDNYGAMIIAVIVLIRALIILSQNSNNCNNDHIDNSKTQYTTVQHNIVKYKICSYFDLHY